VDTRDMGVVAGFGIGWGRSAAVGCSVQMSARLWWGRGRGVWFYAVILAVFGDVRCHF